MGHAPLRRKCPWCEYRIQSCTRPRFECSVRDRWPQPAPGPRLCFRVLQPGFMAGTVFVSLVHQKDKIEYVLLKSHGTTPATFVSFVPDVDIQHAPPDVHRWHPQFSWGTSYGATS